MGSPNYIAAMRQTPQKRRYRLDGGELRYEVPPRADGSIPISVWRRME